MPTYYDARRAHKVDFDDSPETILGHTIKRGQEITSSA
jgi:hypothetical protein